MIKPSLVSGIIVLALSGGVGYYMGDVRPRNAVEHLQRQRKEALQEQQLRIHVASLLESLEGAQRLLAPTREADWLLQEVGRLAQESGVKVVSITPHAPRTANELTILSVSVQLAAGYHQLGHFLSRIESYGRLLQVDELNVTAQAGDGKAQARLIISAFNVPPLPVDRQPAG